MNDIAWKMNSRIALPTHVECSAHDEALARMGRLLERVDDRLIMTHPTLKRDYRLFVLELKKAVPLVWHAAPGALAVTRGDEVVFAAEEADAVLQRIAVREGRLFMEGRVESPFFAGWQGA